MVPRPARRSLRIVRPREAFSGRDRVFGLKSGRAVSNRIAAAAKAAKLDGRFSGHSPRIGMAVDLVRAGIPTAAVQVAGAGGRADDASPAGSRQGKGGARGGGKGRGAPAVSGGTGASSGRRAACPAGSGSGAGFGEGGGGGPGAAARRAYRSAGGDP